MSIKATAKRAGFTRHIIAEREAQDLYLWVKPTSDLESTFTAICDETGDVLKVNGRTCLVRDLED
jgi:hypothetical protein